MSNFAVSNQTPRIDPVNQTNSTHSSNAPTTSTSPRSTVNFSDTSPLLNQQSLIAPVTQNLLQQPIQARDSTSGINQATNTTEQNGILAHSGPRQGSTTEAERQSALAPPDLTPASLDITARTTNIDLTSSEQAILNNIYARDDNNRLLDNASLSVKEGEGSAAGLSAGDVITINTTDGQSYEHTLTQDNMYDLRFRENMQQAINSAGTGWSFDASLVDLPSGTMVNESRQYTDQNGQIQTETVLKKNDYWELVQRGGQKHLIMRETNDAGEQVKASDAVNDIFNNKNSYAFDCATPMSVFNLKATLDTIGEDDFNANVGQLNISSWGDPLKPNEFDGGYTAHVRRAGAGEVSVNGVPNLAGEYARFDPSQDGGDLRIGNAYYFDKPGDNSSASQGWNGIYMGQNANGEHQFWVTTQGIQNVSFNNDGSWTPNGGFLAGHYLGAVSMSPDLRVLRGLDRT